MADINVTIEDAQPINVTLGNNQPINVSLGEAVNLYQTIDGDAAWGVISGELSDQTDLQEALDAKASTASLSTVATTGSYTDLADKPTIPTVPSTVVESVVAGDNITVDNTDPANPVVAGTASGGGIELVASATADGTSTTLSVSELSLDDDLHYYIEVFCTPASSGTSMSWQVNDDNTTSNYRAGYWLKSGSAVAAATGNTNSVHVVQAFESTPTMLTMNLRKVAGTYLIGDALSNRGSLGTPDMRQYVIGRLNTENVISFGVYTTSGPNIGAGTTLKVYKL